MSIFNGSLCFNPPQANKWCILHSSLRFCQLAQSFQNEHFLAPSSHVITLFRVFSTTDAGHLGRAHCLGHKHVPTRENVLIKTLATKQEGQKVMKWCFLTEAEARLANREQLVLLPGPTIEGRDWKTPHYTSLRSAQLHSGGKRLKRSQHRKRRYVTHF